MENARRNFRGEGMHGRLFHWAKNKMTGQDAFDIIYGEKGRQYPEEMKQEFTALFDEMKEAHRKLHEDRKAYMDKWKDYAPEECGIWHGECTDGREFHGHGEGFHRGGFGFGR